VGQLLESVAGVELHPARELPVSVPVPAGSDRIALLFVGGVASLSFPETGRQSRVVPVAQEINDLSWDIMVEQELHGMTLSLSSLVMNAKEHSREETEDRSCGRETWWN
jgi:hypothetical protein